MGDVTSSADSALTETGHICSIDVTTATPASHLSLPDLPAPATREPRFGQLYISSPRMGSRRALEMCLLWGEEPISLSKAKAVCADNSIYWTTWQKECGASFCSALSLPESIFLEAFSYGPYCPPCLQNAWDLNFAVKHKQQERIALIGGLFTEKLEKHYTLLQKGANYMGSMEIAEPQNVFSSCTSKDLRYRFKMLDLIVKGLEDVKEAKNKKDTKEKENHVFECCDSDGEDLAVKGFESPPWTQEDVEEDMSMDVDNSHYRSKDKFPGPGNDELNEIQEIENLDVDVELIQTTSRPCSLLDLDTPKRKSSEICKQVRPSPRKRAKLDDDDDAQEEANKEGNEQDPLHDIAADESSDVVILETDFVSHTNRRTGLKKNRKNPRLPRSPAGLMKYKYPCELCPQIFTSQDRLNDHNRGKHPGQIFVCKFCEKKYKSLDSLEAHLKKMHALAHLDFICFTCKMAFETQAELKEHEPIHASDTPFKCSICLEVFTKSKDLSLHVQRHVNPFPCEQCCLSFASLEGFKLHAENHIKRVRCEICGTLWQSEARLKVHMQVHSDSKKFQCDLCPLSYKYKQSLVLHKRGHTGERPFSCKFCHKTFLDAGSLSRHDVTHSGIRTLICNFCGREYESYTGYKRHLRQVHHIDAPIPKTLETQSPLNKSNGESRTVKAPKPPQTKVSMIAEPQSVPRTSSKLAHKSPIAAAGDRRRLVDYSSDDSMESITIID